MAVPQPASSARRNARAMSRAAPPGQDREPHADQQDVHHPAAPGPRRPLQAQREQAHDEGGDPVLRARSERQRVERSRSGTAASSASLVTTAEVTTQLVGVTAPRAARASPLATTPIAANPQAQERRHRAQQRAMALPRGPKRDADG